MGATERLLLLGFCRVKLEDLAVRLIDLVVNRLDFDIDIRHPNTERKDDRRQNQPIESLTGQA